MISGQRLLLSICPRCARGSTNHLSHLAAALVRKAGGNACIDVFTFHVYAGDVATVARLVGTLKAVHPAGKQVHVTEFGWNVQEVGEARQAANLAATIVALAGTSWINVAMPYEMVDDPWVSTYRMGLWRGDLSPRPAVEAMRVAIAAVRRK